MDIAKAREARARKTTRYPILAELSLGDPGDWGRRVVTLLLHESGEVSWDAAGYQEQEAVELDGFFGIVSRPEPARSSPRGAQKLTPIP